MDLIDNPELKSTYDKCKYRVKLWEYHFKKQHGRLPSKLDIREAENEVRFAYKTYFNLKSAAIERTFTDIDGFEMDEDETRQGDEAHQPEEKAEEIEIAEGVWGKHLNNKIVNEVKNDKPRVSLNSSFSQKLFNGSKFSKRNPRKSLSSQTQKKKDDTKNQTQEFEVGSPKNSQDFFDLFVSQNEYKLATPQQDLQSQALDLVQSLLNRDYKLRTSLDTGWIDRVTKNTGIGTDHQDEGHFSLTRRFTQALEKKGESFEDDSDDVIANSEDESYEVRHVFKKIKMDSTVKSVNTTAVKVDGVNNLDVSKVDNEPASQIMAEDLNETKLNEIETQGNKTKKARKKSNAKQTKSKTKKPPERAKRPIYLGEFSDSESSASPNLAPNQDDDKTETSKSTKKAAKSKSVKEKHTSDLTDRYELEYSVNPRIITVPRITHVKRKTKKEPNREETSDEDKPKTKQSVAKDKLEKKIASGGLNDNYVTINMKKKVYVRGKKGMNFSKYKKQQWKNKKKALCGPDMDMGGCDGGMLTCFNCGDIGHFARQCPKRKGGTLLPLNVVEGEDEEECPFPTLEEAEKLAEESALAVRKSNKRLTNKSGDMEEEIETPEIIGDSQSDTDDDDDILLAEAIKLEEFVTKLDTQAYIDSTTYVRPYYDLNEDGSIKDTPEEVFETLKKFGFDDFRPGQETAVMRILSGKSTLVTLSTGSGKSLCYQLPAYIYSKREPCISLVISPLVSLMEDQVTGLPPFLKAACLHTNQTKTQREKVMELVLSGALSILLVSPEAVAAGERSTGFGSLLRRLPPISFACIDEAHCVSQWSHNFRPSYLMICRILRERLGVKIILGLTATATVSTGNNIVRHLQIPDGSEGIISDLPLPDNLRLTVSKDANRDDALLGLITSERFAQCRSIIVYCTRREECERIAAFLRMAFKGDKPQMEGSNGRKRKRLRVEAQPYHAGLSAAKRKSVQKSFMSGELRIVVATVAFGMGINKSDIRSVIHYNMPSSFESYVQEIGRAGRDGLPAHCHLFLDSQNNDENELRRHIHSNSIDRHVIRKLLRRIFVPCSCKDSCPKHEVAFSIQDTIQYLDVPEENIATLLCYLELHERRFVQVLSPAYAICKIISYRGAGEIKKAAKDCPPLTMALVLHGDEGSKDNIFEFPAVDVAAAMGWDSGICKHKLKNLEWTSANGVPKRSNLTVEFSNLAFRLLAPGNLTETELDDTLDYLYKRVVDQEHMCLRQLRALHTTLTGTAARSYKDCLSQDVNDNEKSLKEKIREYFNSSDPLAGYEPESAGVESEESIVKDTRQLVNMYRDNVFTGRAVGRIFHGIQSPNYPAVIWGRCRFWRSHLRDDFHEICRIATGEILKMR